MLLLCCLLLCLVPVKGYFGPVTAFRGHWLSDSGYRLGYDKLESGAYPVEVQVQWASYGPLCEDQLNDRTALQLCRMKGLDGGRRTTYTTKDDFIETGLSCYERINTQMVTRTLTIVETYDKCSSVEYSKKRSLPCARNQAAAVFCYDRKEPVTFEIYDGESKPTGHVRKFSISFRMRVIKMGRTFEVVGKQGMRNYNVTPDNFLVDSCEEVQDFALSISGPWFHLKSSYSDLCLPKVVELYFMGEHFLKLVRSS